MCDRSRGFGITIAAIHPKYILDFLEHFYQLNKYKAYFRISLGRWNDLRDHYKQQMLMLWMWSNDAVGQDKIPSHHGNRGCNTLSNGLKGTRNHSVQGITHGIIACKASWPDLLQPFKNGE